MTDLQQKIYDMVSGWAELAAKLGPLVSPDFYYAWLLRAKLAPQDELKAALRQMVDSGIITARVVKYNAPAPAAAAEIAYNTGSAASTTAVILALPEAEVEKMQKVKSNGKRGANSATK